MHSNNHPPILLAVSITNQNLKLTLHFISNYSLSSRFDEVLLAPLPNSETTDIVVSPPFFIPDIQFHVLPTDILLKQQTNNSINCLNNTATTATTHASFNPSPVVKYIKHCLPLPHYFSQINPNYHSVLQYDSSNW